MAKKIFGAIYWKRAQKYLEKSFAYGGKLTLKNDDFVRDDPYSYDNQAYDNLARHHNLF